MRNKLLIFKISLPLLFLAFTLKAQEKLDSLPSYQSFYLNDSLKFRLVGDTLNYKDYGCLECVQVIIDNNFNVKGRLYLSINRNGDIEKLSYYESGEEKLRYQQKDEEYPTVFPKSVGYRTKDGKWKSIKL